MYGPPLCRKRKMRQQVGLRKCIRPSLKHKAPGHDGMRCGAVCGVSIENFFQLGVGDAELPAPNGGHSCDGRVLERVAKGLPTDQSTRAYDDKALQVRGRNFR
jgi:hypothetical protein